jgi:hypothetical protein
MEIPIACSLDAIDGRAQLGEWKEVFERVMLRVDRITPNRLEVTLRQELAELKELVQLAQREKACCPFFGFALIIGSTSTALVVEVPEGSSKILDDFISNMNE